MKKFRSSHLALISFLLISFATVPILHAQTLSAEKIYKQVSDAVVVILSYDSNNELSKQGSGVVINDKGYVVTNYHVLAGNDRLEVYHNKEIIPYADIIGIDVEKDILILKIEDKKFPAIKIGNSDKLSVGQRVYAIGSPLGYENTISEGIISGLRSYEESERSFIQITASISPGSSGGAVVNDKGELIGISTLTDKEGQNLNFAIPINDVLSVEVGSYSKNDASDEFEWYYKGLEASRMGLYRDAIKYFTNHIELNPNEENGYFHRGNAKVDIQDYNGAIIDYNEHIKMNPNSEHGYFQRAIAKCKFGKEYEGIEDYTKAIELNPTIAIFYHNRGIAKMNIEDYDGAIKDFDREIVIIGDDSDAYYYRGSSKLELIDISGALQDLNKAIKIDPSNAYCYTKRAAIKMLLGDEVGGCLDLSKAGELGLYEAYEMIRKYCN